MRVNAAVVTGLGVFLLGAGSLDLWAAAQAPESAPDVSGLSLEQLGGLDVVYAASRHLQTQREAPSSVTVVTAAEIRRFGHRTLGDVLRQVPSFYITDDHNYSYVGVRGFSRPGDYSTRVLLLLDGMRMNDNIYDQGSVGRELLLDAALIERVEIVRGPGAAMYGNSAFFAVINVVTRRGEQVDGGQMALELGSHDTAGGRATYGRRTGEVDFLVSTSFWRTGGSDLYFPEFDGPDTHDGRAVGLNAEQAGNVFATLGYRGLTLRAHHTERDKDIPTGSYETLFGDPRNRTRDVSTRLTAEYDRELGAFASSVRLHHGRYDYQGLYVYPPDLLNDDGASGRWWALELNASSRRMGRHLLTFGGEVQDNGRQDQTSIYPVLGEVAVDHRDSSWRWGVYAQDDLRVTESLVASIGARYDWHAALGARTSPRLGLVWAATPKLTVKALYGTAFRAPNEYEVHYYTEAADLAPETIETTELVIEHYVAAHVRLTASVFENDIDGLITLDDTEDGLRFHNAEATRSRGLELTAEAKRGRDLRLRASYGYQLTTDVATGAELSNSPRHLAKVSTSLPLGSRVLGGLALQYVSARRALRGGYADAAFLTDVTLTVPSLVHRLDVGLTVRNLFDTKWADPGSEEHLQRVIPQDGRRIDLKLVWRF